MNSSKPSLSKERQIKATLRSAYSVLLIALLGLTSCIAIFLLTGNADVVEDIFNTLKSNASLAMDNLVALNFEALLDQWFQGVFSLLFLGIMGLPAVLFLHLTSNPDQRKSDQ